MPLTPQALRARLAKQNWTSHNIRLTDEITTQHGQPDFIQTDLRLKAIVRFLSFAYRDMFVGLRIADLGCLEGGFALALAQRGADVLGIEARAKNLEKAQLLQDHFGLPNLSFGLGDVKDFTQQRFGIFDVVLALGILYHLDSPAIWLRQISAAARGVLIIDAHYAPADDAALRLLDPRLMHLGSLQTIDVGGWQCHGRWYEEYPESADREDQLWASYSNRRSFWLTKESLLLSLCRSGWDLVLEQHDFSADRYQFFNQTFPRVMLVAVKSANFGRS